MYVGEKSTKNRLADCRIFKGSWPGRYMRGQSDPWQLAENRLRLPRTCFPTAYCPDGDRTPGTGTDHPGTARIAGRSARYRKDDLFNACLNEEFLKRLREARKRADSVAGSCTRPMSVFTRPFAACLGRNLTRICAYQMRYRLAPPWNRMRALERMRELGAVIIPPRWPCLRMSEDLRGRIDFRQFLKIVRMRANRIANKKGTIPLLANP